ncbi:MAG: MgtC/SapB family protein [Bacillota bacterium]
MSIEVTIGLRLFLAAFLGGVIGLQRESINRPAGFRTHTLVATGSALVMLVSIYGFEQYAAIGRLSDPARLAAQVVSGIGFLGAGTILKDGNTIRGLTTAASLWVVSGIGLAAGAGFYAGAVITTILVYVSLSALGLLQRRLFSRSQYHSLMVLAADRPGQLGAIASFMGRHNVSILNVQVHREESDDGHAQVLLQVKLPAELALNQLVSELTELNGVAEVSSRD